MTEPITSLPAAVAALGALPMPAGPARLTPEREAEIAERAPKRAAALTAWIDKFSPLAENQRAVENAETVLEEDVPALLAELAAVRKERDEAQARVADVEAEREKLIRWHGEDSKAITRLMARVTELQENLRAVNAGWDVARARVDTWEKAAEQIRHIHKDSPMGPCPVCVDGDAMARGDDPTVPYPCPTARLAGATDCDPPSFRNTAGRGENR